MLSRDCEEDSFILSKEGSKWCEKNERQAKIDRICLLNRNIFSQVQNLKWCMKEINWKYIGRGNQQSQIFQMDGWDRNGWQLKDLAYDMEVGGCRKYGQDHSAMRRSRHGELDYWKDSTMGITQKSKSPRMIEKERKPWRVSELLAKFSLNEKGWPQCLLMIGTRAGSLIGGCHMAWTTKELKFSSEEVDRNWFGTTRKTKENIYPTLKIYGIFKRLTK